MRIIDEKALERARNRPRCEWCRKPNRVGLHAAHWRRRGLGGGHRIDDDWCVLSLCAACHDDDHAGVISRADLLERIAMREGVPAETITSWLDLVARLPKGSEIPEKLR